MEIVGGLLVVMAMTRRHANLEIMYRMLRVFCFNSSNDEYDGF